jgi:hypothetical protein
MKNIMCYYHQNGQSLEIGAFNYTKTFKRILFFNYCFYHQLKLKKD